MARSSSLVAKATAAATEKAAEIAGGYIGARAGQFAGEKLRRYAPEIRHRYQETSGLAKEEPGKVFFYALLTGAVLAAGWVAFQQAGRK